MRKLPLLLMAVVPFLASANPVACPTSGTLAQFIALSSCSYSDFIVSNFSFSSTALTGSLSFSDTEITVTPYMDEYYQGRTYEGLQFTGSLLLPGGDSTVTDIDYTVTMVGTDRIGVVADSVGSAVDPGGSVSLTDTGTTSDGTSFSITASNTLNTAGLLIVPAATSIANQAVLDTVGPEGTDSFRLKIESIPEPATTALLGLGLVALGICGKRRIAGR